MGVSAIIDEGKITNATSALSKSEEKKGGSTLGKDDFLQLLVAQMKFQDPLEPTSNTEYISQYATFSEVEQMQNMSQNMDLSRASTLVGKTVQITTTGENGADSTIMGKVDYVKYEAGKAYLSIDEELYSLDDLSYVCDEDYLKAYDMAETMVKKMKDLPDVDKVSLNNKEKVEEVIQTYDNMNEYQKTFVAKSLVDLIENYRQKLEEVVKNAQELADNTSDDENGTDGNA